MLVGMGIVNPDSERGGSTRVNNEPGGQIYYEGVRNPQIDAVASRKHSANFHTMSLVHNIEERSQINDR